MENRPNSHFPRKIKKQFKANFSLNFFKNFRFHELKITIRAPAFTTYSLASNAKFGLLKTLSKGYSQRYGDTILPEKLTYKN